MSHPGQPWFITKWLWKYLGYYVMNRFSLWNATNIYIGHIQYTGEEPFPTCPSCQRWRKHLRLHWCESSCSAMYWCNVLLSVNLWRERRGTASEPQGHQWRHPDPGSSDQATTCCRHCQRDVPHEESCSEVNHPNASFSQNSCSDNLRAIIPPETIQFHVSRYIFTTNFRRKIL